MGCLPLYNWRASFPGAGAEAAFLNAARENMTLPITRIHLQRPSIPTLLRSSSSFPASFPEAGASSISRKDSTSTR